MFHKRSERARKLFEHTRKSQIHHAWSLVILRRPRHGIQFWAQTVLANAVTSSKTISPHWGIHEWRNVSISHSPGLNAVMIIDENEETKPLNHEVANTLKTTIEMLVRFTQQTWVLWFDAIISYQSMRNSPTVSLECLGNLTSKTTVILCRLSSPLDATVISFPQFSFLKSSLHSFSPTVQGEHK